MTTQDAAPAAGEPVADLTERTAQLIAHRVCCGTEHDPANGKLHGYCVVCGVPWPCEYAGCRVAPPDSLAVAQALEKAAKVCKELKKGKRTSEGIAVDSALETAISAIRALIYDHRLVNRTVSK